MTGPFYRVKLYGHTEKDDETFCQELASVLRIQPGQAKALLAKAPVVLKKKATEEQAERLRKVIQSVKGLCIIEELNDVGGISNVKKKQVESLEKILTRKPPEVPQSDKSAETSQMKTLIIGAIGSLAVIVMLMIFNSVTPKPSDEEPIALSHETNIPANAPLPPEPEPLRSPEEIRDDIFDLKASIDGKAMILGKLMNELKALYYKGGHDKDLIKYKKAEILETKKEFRVLKNELKDLKYELRLAEQDYGTDESSVVIEQESDYKFKIPGTTTSQ